MKLDLSLSTYAVKVRPSVIGGRKVHPRDGVTVCEQVSGAARAPATIAEDNQDGPPPLLEKEKKGSARPISPSVHQLKLKRNVITTRLSSGNLNLPVQESFGQWASG